MIGTHSVIDDVGTGNLILQTNGTQITLQSSSEYFVTAQNNGAVTLYHNGSQKLATTSTGIDVTGTVTSDGLTVDGSISKNSNYNITQFFKADGSTRLAYILFRDDNPNFFEYNDTATQPLYFINNNKKVLGLESNSDIAFYDDTGTTQGLFWDSSAERLGIGTTSPSNPLTLESSVDYVANFKSTDTTAGILLTDSNAQGRVTNTNGNLCLSADINNEEVNYL